MGDLIHFIMSEKKIFFFFKGNPLWESYLHVLAVQTKTNSISSSQIKKKFFSF